MVRVKLENVAKTFGDTVATDIATLEVKDKQLGVLVGPSGCGKSTTLRLIAGLEEPDEGKIYIGDKVVNGLPPTDRNVAMIFQNFGLYPHMSAFDNMAYGLRNLGFEEEEIRERIENAVETLHIERLVDRKPGRMSGGEKQRVALGRALVRDPDVYLWDEPLSNLDAKLRREMRTELQEIHKKLEATTIHVTHNQTEAFTMGDTVAVMKAGGIRQIGAPEEIYERPVDEFVAGFMGSPSINFFDCSLVEKDEDLQLDAGEFSLPVPSDLKDTILEEAKTSKAKLGVRPQDISITGNGRDYSVVGEIRVVETLETNYLIHFSIGNLSAVAVVEKIPGMEAGKEVNLQFSGDKMHLFDSKTGKAIL